MNDQEKNELYDKALETFGAKNLLLKLVEECNELAVEIMYHLRAVDKNSSLKLEAADKIADVQIMCEQATRILGIGTMVETFWQVKLKRLKNGLGELHGHRTRRNTDGALRTRRERRTTVGNRSGKNNAS